MTMPSSQSSSETPKPKWGKTVTQRLEWCAFMLETYPKIYPRYKNFGLQMMSRYPGRQVSSEMIVNLLRASPEQNTAEEYDVNSNLKSLYARLFKADVPQSKIDLRKCWIDDCTPEEWAFLLEAHRRGQQKLLS